VIDFYILTGYHYWPAFNVADSAVTTSTFWLSINIVKGKKLLTRQALNEVRKIYSAS